MKKIFGFLFLLVSLAQPVFAHGEDQTGPHGGFVRMPGAFHTEVIPEKNGLKIMLLDINFQNPTIKNSSIKVTIKNEMQATHLKCKAKVNAFFCAVNKGALASGTLEILPVREKAEGAMVKYALPLKLEQM